MTSTRFATGIARTSSKGWREGSRPALRRTQRPWSARAWWWRGHCRTCTLRAKCLPGPACRSKPSTRCRSPPSHTRPPSMCVLQCAGWRQLPAAATIALCDCRIFRFEFEGEEVRARIDREAGCGAWPSSVTLGGLDRLCRPAPTWTGADGLRPTPHSPAAHRARTAARIAAGRRSGRTVARISHATIAITLRPPPPCPRRRHQCARRPGSGVSPARPSAAGHRHRARRGDSPMAWLADVRGDGERAGGSASSTPRPRALRIWTMCRSWGSVEGEWPERPRRNVFYPRGWSAARTGAAGKGGGQRRARSSAFGAGGVSGPRRSRRASHARLDLLARNRIRRRTLDRSSRICRRSGCDRNRCSRCRRADIRVRSARARPAAPARGGRSAPPTRSVTGARFEGEAGALGAAAGQRQQARALHEMPVPVLRRERAAGDGGAGRRRTRDRRSSAAGSCTNCSRPSSTNGNRAAAAGSPPPT